MKKLLSLTLLSILSIVANAQANFNFKARNTIGYSNTVFHLQDILNMKQNIHSFVYQRVINRRTCLILNYSFSKSQLHINTDKGPSLGVEDPKATSTSSSIINFTANEKNIYYKVAGYSVGIRKFITSKGAIAPYGSFVEIKTGYDNLSRNPKDSLKYYQQNKQSERLYNIPNAGIDHIGFINLHAGIGATRAITKNLSFTWVLNFGINIPIWKSVSREQSFTDTRKSFVLNDDEFFFSHADRTHQTNNAMNFSIGLNYSF